MSKFLDFLKSLNEVGRLVLSIAIIAALVIGYLTLQSILSPEDKNLDCSETNTCVQDIEPLKPIRQNHPDKLQPLIDCKPSLCLPRL